jgi:hypothetical protein
MVSFLQVSPTKDLYAFSRFLLNFSPQSWKQTKKHLGGQRIKTDSNVEIAVVERTEH